MSLLRKNILGVAISIASKSDILEEIKKYLFQKTQFSKPYPLNKIKPFLIFTPNPEIIIYARKNDSFRKIVNTGQINIADGGGVCFALKKIYQMKTERISGVDLMLELIDLAAKNGVTVGLIGGEEGVALEARECLKKKYPEIKIEVLESPKVVINKKKVLSSKHQALTMQKESKENMFGSKYLILSEESRQAKETDNYFQALIKTIKKKNIYILFVALGFPKQEYFIENIRFQISRIKYCQPLVMMGVGGSFDYISGRIKRAPCWIRDLGFEWLYRLIRQPWRLPRQIKGAEFFWRLWRNSSISN